MTSRPTFDELRAAFLEGTEGAIEEAAEETLTFSDRIRILRNRAMLAAEERARAAHNLKRDDDEGGDDR